MNIKEIYSKAEVRFNTFKMREQLLICAAVIAVLYFSWHTILYDYILATDEEISRKSEQIKEQINSLSGKIDTISEVLGRDPTFVLAQQSRDLKRENDVLSKKIYENTKKMVSPKEMTKILSAVIQETQGLTVVNMESLESKPLFAAKSIEEDGKTKQFQVFNHGLKVELSGGYLETTTFLKGLERKNMNVIWDEIEYEVKKYPKAKVVIVMHTLSLDEGWVDV